jgi:hypothetical protein
LVGGGKRITRVEVTLDGGETWLVCVLDLPEKPTKYGKHWCWCFWSVEVEVLDLLGAKEIAVRAWDQSHNTQPEKLIWNLMVGASFRLRPRRRRCRRRWQIHSIGWVFAGDDEQLLVQGEGERVPAAQG